MKAACLLILAVASTFVLAADSQRVLYRIGDITVGGLLGSELPDGCSCGFHYPPESGTAGWMILGWKLGNEEIKSSPASMFIGGKLEKLNIVKDIAHGARKNQTVSCSLVGPDTRVEASLVVTSVCDGTRECDGKGLKGTLSVTHGTAKASIPVTGGCGC